MTSLQISEFFLSELMSVLRPQATSSGVSAPVEILSGIKCTQVSPHDTDQDIQEKTQTFRAQWVVYCEQVGIRIGDVLILDGDTEEYEVERVNKWGSHMLECRLLQQAM